MKQVLTLAAAIALIATPSIARDLVTTQELVPTEAESSALAGTFFDYRLVEVDLDRASEAARAGGELSLVISGRQLDLDLEINNLRSEGYKRYATLDDGVTLVELEIPPVSTYKGTVVGRDDSTVRLSIRDERFRGFVRMGNETLWFDPMSDHVAGTDPSRVIVYRADDVISDPENSKCGMDRALHGPEALGLDVAGAAAPGPRAEGLREWEVATEADGEWEDTFGQTGGLNEIEDIINDVDGIYITDLGLTVNIAFQHIWTNANTDPFIGNDAEDNLFDLLDYWNDPPPGITRNHPRRDMVHHFSGKNFSFGVVGIAFLDAVCRFQNTDDNFSFGISQDFGTNNQQIQLTAHEMGHNWGSDHDESIGCGSQCNGSGPIMCSFIQSNPDLEFSSCSISAINGHVASFGDLCLDP